MFLRSLVFCVITAMGCGSQCCANDVLPASDVLDRSDNLENIAYMKAVMRVVQEDMLDPESARFTNVFMRPVAGLSPVVCGFVNGKNSFGGYTGRKLFMSFGVPGRSLIRKSDEDYDFHSAWNEYCRVGDLPELLARVDAHEEKKAREAESLGSMSASRRAYFDCINALYKKYGGDVLYVDMTVNSATSTSTRVVWFESPNHRIRCASTQGDFPTLAFYKK